MGDAELFIIQSQRLLIPDLALGEKSIPFGPGARLTSDQQEGLVFSIRDRFLRFRGDEHARGFTNRDPVPLFENDVAPNPLTIGKSAVTAAEVSEDVVTGRIKKNQAVLFRNLWVENRDAVPWQASDGVMFPEADFARSLSVVNDQFRHVVSLPKKKSFFLSSRPEQ